MDDAFAHFSFSAWLSVGLIDGDDGLRDETCRSLRRKGFDVAGFANSAAFYRQHAARPCDIVVIDIGLPGEDGLSIAARLRRSSAVGIVLLSARARIEDRLRGLQVGADHCMAKPFHVDELALQLLAIGRRLVVRPAAPAASPAGVPPEAPAPRAGPPAPLCMAAWHLEECGCVLVSPRGRRTVLTTAERAFMAPLMRQPGEVVSRATLWSAIGANETTGTARIEAIAKRLRRKVARLAGGVLPLHTVRGVGYLMPDGDDARG